MFVNPALGAKEAYVPGLTQDYVAKKFGIPFEDVAKLGSAENPFGPSPKALAAIKVAMKVDNYPEWTAKSLREKVASKYGWMPEQVICGCGETEIMSWIIRSFSRLGDEILMFVPAFPIYHMAAENEGRVPVYIGMGDELKFNWNKFLDAIQPEVKIVFLTNPHSPTGRLLSEKDIRSVCERAKNQLVVLDEAYIHFSNTNGAMNLVKEYKNLIVLRTFSKVYGLAGLRVGFGIAAPEIIAPLMHLKPTWNIGALQVAGAIAALDDDEYVAMTIKEITRMREYILSKIATLSGFSIVGKPSSNFFLMRIEDPSIDSSQMFEELLKRGVIVKDGSVSFIGLGKRFLRIDVSRQKQMERLAWALEDIHKSLPLPVLG